MRDTIIRLDRDAPELRQLVATGQPFIVRDLLADSFIAPIDDRAHVLRTFGDAVALQRDRPTMSVAAYFEADDVQRGSIATRIPPAFEARLAELAKQPPLACDHAATVVWIGRAGCKQRFHCDMDCSGIFLAQALGTKRICLVAPRHTQKLQPGLDREILLAEVPFQVADRDEQARFLAYADGLETSLGPGETLHIPPLWWHFVEYETDSVAISWHARSALEVDPSAAWSLLWKHEWPLWQGIVAALSTNADLRHMHGSRARALLDRLADPRATDAAAELHALHDEVCPGRYVRPLVPGDAAFFERRSLRPLQPMTRAWAAGDAPRTQPYLTFATASSKLVVLDGSRLLAELAFDDETEALATIALAVQDATPGTTVAALAEHLECDAADLCAVLGELSARGWISRAA